MAPDGQRVLAVIPARAGSVRCPNKNYRDFRGKPLFMWSVEASKGSKYIDKLVVSTDHSEIKAHCLWQAISFLNRPKELSGSDASNEDVLRHVLKRFPDFGWVVLLQPTSPLRTSEDIDKCLEIAQSDMGCVSYRETGTKNGAVYVARTPYLLGGGNFDKAFRAFYIMPEERSADLDYLEEFALWE